MSTIEGHVRVDLVGGVVEPSSIRIDARPLRGARRRSRSATGVCAAMGVAVGVFAGAAMWAFALGVIL